MPPGSRDRRGPFWGQGRRTEGVSSATACPTAVPKTQATPTRRGYGASPQSDPPGCLGVVLRWPCGGRTRRRPGPTAPSGRSPATRVLSALAPRRRCLGPGRPGPCGGRPSPGREARPPGAGRPESPDRRKHRRRWGPRRAVGGSGAGPAMGPGGSRGRRAEPAQGGDPQLQEWVLPRILGAEDPGLIPDGSLDRDGPAPDNDRGHPHPEGVMPLRPVDGYPELSALSHPPESLGSEEPPVHPRVAQEPIDPMSESPAGRPGDPPPLRRRPGPPPPPPP